MLKINFVKALGETNVHVSDYEILMRKDLATAQAAEPSALFLNNDTIPEGFWGRFFKYTKTPDGLNIQYDYATWPNDPQDPPGFFE